MKEEAVAFASYGNQRRLRLRLIFWKLNETDILQPKVWSNYYYY